MDTRDRILVAGGGGFIGGSLVPDVDNRRLDLSEIGSAREAVDGVRVVYDLAADMGGMGFIENNKALCMLSVLINTHLLEASVAAEVARFFFSSSACVYAADKQTDPA